jgi:two-component system sensor histidine kinase BaeS
MFSLRALRFNLWLKLVLAFLLVAVAGVAVVSFLANRATSTGFRRFLDSDAGGEWAGLQDMLADFYAERGNWEGVNTLLAAVQPGRGQGSLGLALLDENDQLVSAAGGQRNRPATAAEADISLPIVTNGRQVGTLLVSTPGQGNSRAGEQFLSEVNQAILWGGLVAVLLALSLGVLLTLRLTRPLRQLTQATQQLASGQLEQQVEITSRDELGELATSFNEMAAALQLSEHQRQQLLADVAHELRTPISIMRSHIEAMLDGVFDMSPENLAVAHEETILLGRLVEDLRTLSLAEAGQLPLNRAEVDLASLATQSITAFGPLAEAEGVRLTADIPSDLPPVKADAGRIQQLLANLLTNALHHAGEEEPQVRVKAAVQGDFVQVEVKDNGPGLSLEAQEHVFDRFWRADASRNRDYGGSGLGLAICRAIVTAHKGHIWVESQPGQGATFAFTIPTASR